MTDEEIAALVARAMARDRLTKAEINTLLRACLVPMPGHMLACCDYGQVEARALAWAAGDHEAVKVFQSGADPYARLACRLFSLDPATFSKKTHAQARDTSKKAELGCGYGMGGPKFRVTAEKGGMVWTDSMMCVEETGEGLVCTDPLCGAEVDPNCLGTATHGSATIVALWREVHAPIVQFWYALNDAFIAACAGRRTGVGPYEFGKVGNDVWAMMPSGRPIVYPHAHVSKDEKGRPRARYKGTRHTEDLYGGKLAENVTQALCRDLLALSLVKAEEAGLRPVLHVHDELVCEVPCAYADDALKVLEAIMKDLPPWAVGFPVAVDGFIAKRYRK